MYQPKEKHYFTDEKKLLHIIGLPLDGGCGPIYWLLRSPFLFVVMTYPFVQMYSLWTLLDQWDNFLELLIYEFPTITSATKYVLVLLHRKKLSNIVKKLGQGVFLPSEKRGGTQEINLNDQCVSITEKQKFIYWFIMIVIVGCGTARTTMMRLFDHNSVQLTYGTMVMFNLSNNYQWTAATTYQTLAGSLTCASYSATDLLSVGIFVHVAYQYKMLQNCISRLIVNSHRQMTEEKRAVHHGGDAQPSDIDWKYLQAKIKEAVEYHIAVKELAMEAESCFSLMVFNQILTNVATTCVTWYEVQLVSATDARLYVIAAIYFTLLFQMLTLCYWGNVVTTESANVASACYDIDFIGSDVRFQKSLQIMIQMSQRQVCFTSGKLAPLSLQTFVSLYKATYSYYLILQKHRS